MSDVSEFRRLLQDHEAELIRRLDAIKQDVRNETNPVSSDSAEQATERENDEVIDALGSSARHELKLIRQSYQRMDDGEYFECSICGDPINLGRLRMIPYTQYCVRCAEDEEKLHRENTYAA